MGAAGGRGLEGVGRSGVGWSLSGWAESKKKGGGVS